jgi:pimeloyl-ACP methyl ester carboxylesterase
MSSHSKFLTAPRLEGTVVLDDGRRLGFAEFGAATGRAVFWLHGTPGARRQIPEPARIAAVEHGVRLIGVDRPGVGHSTPHLYHQLLDFASDLRELANRLGIENFGLIGLSGGGPYVLAVAHQYPERVRAAVVLGGVAPAVGPEAAPGSIVALAARFQQPLRLLREPLAFGVSALIWSIRPIASPGLYLYARVSPEGDRRLLLRPEFKAMFLDDLLNGSLPGLRAPVYDAVLFGREWGFSVSDVKVPIEWWHGDADHIIPFSHGKHMVALLPDAHMHVQPGESHLGGLGEAEAVLESLLTAWDRRDGFIPSGSGRRSTGQRPNRRR